jgi:hypothetical protein
MFLPNRAHAFIPPEKLTGYLLSESHIVGRSKARFFRAHGFHEDNVHLLEQGLRWIAQHNEVEQEKTSAHGTKYVIRGTLQTPRGTVVAVETVWIIEKAEDKPSLITAYPG